PGAAPGRLGRAEDSRARSGTAASRGPGARAICWAISAAAFGRAAATRGRGARAGGRSIHPAFRRAVRSARSGDAPGTAATVPGPAPRTAEDLDLRHARCEGSADAGDAHRTAP